MFLLDTSVVSELRRRQADPNVAAWARSVPLPGLFLSAITIEEIEIGVMLAERRDPRQGATLRGWLENQVLTSFADRILPVDVTVARRSAAIHVPDPRPIRDGLIAATALVHGLTVATRNTTDFDPTGVPTFNPWLS
ncbi:type II toxin-antitoxin system VapC family toxin [Inquilinus sp. NPDC058860]|uniref:type II toxin-antitoxin system VapC family toxin n=1 Tax=Inquilinus sp. NPDC058860 TaxID=3346652 RepID=UPI0036738EBF